MKTKDELAEKATESVTGMPHKYLLGSNRRAMATGYFSGFLAGWDACEARVMELLRSENGRWIFRNHSHGLACNLVETKLKGGG